MAAYPQGYDFEPIYDEMFPLPEPPAYEPPPPVPPPVVSPPPPPQSNVPPADLPPPLDYTSPENPDKRYYGTQETVAPGHSTTQSQANDYVAKARAAGIPQGWIDQFLGANPYDYSRLQSAYQSGGPGRTGGPSAPPPGGGPTGGGTYGPPPKRDWEPMDLGQLFAGTGGPGVFQGALQQVGQDPLSQIINGALGDLIQRGGISPMGADIQETLRGIIGRGGALEGGEAGNEPTTGRSRVSLRKENAREQLEAARRTQMGQLESRLAERGLATTPGNPSGAELGSIGRMEERLQGPYAQALQGILGHESELQHATLQNALQLATGIDQGQARFLLDSINSAGNRQGMLSNIALQTLDRNIAWNEFLANLGLQRGQILNQLQAGRIQDILPLIQMFIQSAGISAGGYV